MVFSPKYCTPPVIAQVWNEIKTRDICNNPRKRRNNLRVLLLPRPLLRDSENIFFRQSSIRFHIHLAHELSSRSLNYTNCIGRWAAIEYGVWGDACVQRNATPSNYWSMEKYARNQPGERQKKQNIETLFLQRNTTFSAPLLTKFQPARVSDSFYQEQLRPNSVGRHNVLRHHGPLVSILLSDKSERTSLCTNCRQILLVGRGNFWMIRKGACRRVPSKPFVCCRGNLRSRWAMDPSRRSLQCDRYKRSRGSVLDRCASTSSIRF